MGGRWSGWGGRCVNILCACDDPIHGGPPAVYPLPRMPSAEGARVGRYVIGEEIAAGGMATVHLGRMLGDAGFARTVAIKRVHAQFTRDAEMRGMLLDEGRLSARIHHLNVVTTLDVVATGADLFIVMEYVHGEPLSALIRAASLVRRSSFRSSASASRSARGSATRTTSPFPRVIAV